MTRRRALAWLASVLLALTGCAADDPIGPPEEAAVGVRATGCGLIDRLGTGAVIAADDRTLVVTSAHTVAGSNTIRIERGRSTATVELLALDTERDLAILTAPSWTEPGRQLATPERNAVAEVAVWGPDDGITVSATEITRLLRVTIEDIYVVGEHERRAFEITATIVRGDSGAPVIADDGSVYGIVYARSREREQAAFAVSAIEIADLIGTTGAEAVDSRRCA